MDRAAVRPLLLITAASVVVLLGILFVYRIGFGVMAAASDVAPERLRDFTFPVWHQFPVSKHSFLVFLTPDDYEKGVAYANYPVPYLWLMDVLYHVQQHVPKLTMRLTQAAVTIYASLAAVGYIVCRKTLVCFSPQQAGLVFLAFMYVLTLPRFWIALGKFNVDNGFVWAFPVLILLSHFVVTDGARGKRFWIAAVALCLVMPIAAALFGMFLAFRMVVSPRPNWCAAGSAMVMIAIAVVVYLQPVFVTKWLHMSSANSTWLFRSGLDGDTTYYGNFINSVLFPFFRRPLYLLLIPAALLAAQLWYRKHLAIAGETPDRTATTDAAMPYVFSVYLLTLLFWPQAVSIHPYLYDAHLIAPIAAWIVFNFAGSRHYRRHFLVWAFLVTCNVTKIAQAGHCGSCYYPSWGLTGQQLG